MAENKSSKFESMNRFEASGKITSIGVNRMGRSSITIVMRGRHNKQPDIIDIVLIKPLAFDIKRSDYVKVKGHIRSFRYYNDIRQRYVSVQYFVADEIEKDVPMLTQEFGIPGRHYSSSSFRAFVKGKVTHVLHVENSEWYKMRIETESMEEIDKRLSNIEVGYNASMRLPAFDFQAGDYVAAWVSVRTREKVVDHKKVHFEDLIVEDLARLDENGKYLEKREEPAGSEDTGSMVTISDMEIDLPDEDEESAAAEDAVTENVSRFD